MSNVKTFMRLIDQEIAKEARTVADLRTEWHATRSSACAVDLNHAFTAASIAASNGNCSCFDYSAAAAEWRQVTNRRNRLHQKAWRIVAELMQMGEEPTGDCGCSACVAWRRDHLANFQTGNLGEGSLVWISKAEEIEMAASWKAEAQKVSEKEREFLMDRADRRRMHQAFLRGW